MRDDYEAARLARKTQQHREDVVFFSILGLVVLILITSFSLLGLNADKNEWKQQFNGCYQHVQTDRSVWHDNVTTKTLYCPAKG